MSQFDKLLEQISSLSNDLRFEELKKVLEFYGYTMKTPSGGGSHRTFRKDNCPPITIPVQQPIKKIYVIMVKSVIEEDENYEES
jgi:predicted RNA binding protein YcfA (HicA-like mRNA interferase family)